MSSLNDDTWCHRICCLLSSFYNLKIMHHFIKMFNAALECWMSLSVGKRLSSVAWSGIRWGRGWGRGWGREDVMTKKQNRSRRKVDQKRIICVFFLRRNYDKKCRSRSLLKIIIGFMWSSIDKVSVENNVDRYYEIHLLRGQAKQLF